MFRGVVHIATGGYVETTEDGVANAVEGVGAGKFSCSSQARPRMQIDMGTTGNAF